MAHDNSPLRLAIGLAHAIPRGSVHIAFVDGTTVYAAHAAPGADASNVMTPCGLRALMVMGAWPLGPAARVAGVTVGGPGVSHIGGGVYGSTTPNGQPQRWFATFLAPWTVDEVLTSCPLEFPFPVDGSLRPDGELGVTVVLLSGTEQDDQQYLDDAAQWAVGALYVEEFVRDVQIAR